MNIFFDTDCARGWDEWIKYLALEVGANAENDLGLRGYRCDGLQLIMWKEYPHSFGSVEAYGREAQKSFIDGQRIVAPSSVSASKLPRVSSTRQRILKP